MNGCPPTRLKGPLSFLRSTALVLVLLSLPTGCAVAGMPAEPGSGGEVTVPAGERDWAFWSAGDACWMGSNTGESLRGKFVSSQSLDFPSFQTGDGPFSTCAPATTLALCAGESVNPGTRKTGWSMTYVSGNSAVFLVTAGAGTRTNHGWSVSRMSGLCQVAQTPQQPTPPQPIPPQPTPPRPTPPQPPTLQPPQVQPTPVPPQTPAPSPGPNPPPVTSPPVTSPPPSASGCPSGPNGYSTAVLSWFEDQEPYLSIDVVAYCRVNGQYVDVTNGTCAGAVPGYGSWSRSRSGYKNVYVCTGHRTGWNDR